jgi:hypothetical protein
MNKNYRVVTAPKYHAGAGANGSANMSKSPNPHPKVYFLII